MSYMEDQIQRQYEAWMEQEREWYDLTSQLAHDGWHHCKLNRQLNTEDYKEISRWLRTNYYGRHECFNDEFMFPTEQDANWFMLRWS
jgi:hypothetical protein